MAGRAEKCSAQKKHAEQKSAYHGRKMLSRAEKHSV